jgi:hypothetical protein
MPRDADCNEEFREMAIKSKVLGTLGLGAACAVCCAPLLAPLVFGAGTVGFGTSFGLNQLGLSLDQIICGGVAAAAIACGGYWLWRAQQKAKRAQTCACETTCDTKNVSSAKPA